MGGSWARGVVAFRTKRCCPEDSSARRDFSCKMDLVETKGLWKSKDWSHCESGVTKPRLLLSWVLMKTSLEKAYIYMCVYMFGVGHTPHAACSW